MITRFTAPLAATLLATTACTPDPVTPDDTAIAAPRPPAASQAAVDPWPAAPPMQERVFAPGVISDDREQYRVTFTPSGDTAYFAASDGFFPFTRQASIYRSVRIGDEWQTPVVASFSGTHPDIDPFISPDGGRLYFSSIRPVDGEVRNDATIWVVERDGDGWGEARFVGTATPEDDLYPSVDAAGNLYFATPLPRPDLPQTWNIWVARATADGRLDPVPLGDGVNTPATWDFNPAISPDGERLVFTRLDPADAVATGFGELHVSFLHRGEWTTARNLGAPVNTPLDEYHASFSPDGRMLYFVRRDPQAPDANGDLYEIPVAALGSRLRRGGSVGGR